MAKKLTLVVLLTLSACSPYFSDSRVGVAETCIQAANVVSMAAWERNQGHPVPTARIDAIVSLMDRVCLDQTAAPKGLVETLRSLVGGGKVV